MTVLGKTAVKAGLFGLAVALSACGAGREVILTGERLDPRSGDPVATSDTAANTSAQISLGKQVSRAAWTHTGAGRLHDAGHNAFTAGQPALAWTTPIGTGNSRKFRLTTDPVAAQGVVVTLDAKANLTAVSAVTGTPVWTRDLTPVGEKAGEATGGTLAIDGSTLYATTGYGELIAADLVSGGIKWRQRIDAAGAAGLTVYDGLAYVVGADSRAWAVETATGRVKWEMAGPEAITSRVGAASPAITDTLAIVPFATGDLFGSFRKGGMRLWSASLAGQRKGFVYAKFSDITADPVVIGKTVYTGNQAGRFGAFNVDTGARLWTANEGAYSPATVIGGAVFIVTDRNEIVRLDAKTGARVWGVQLPLYTQEKERKRKGVFAHYGPVAAGGRLWVASSDGVLRGFSPDSGALSAQLTLPAGASSDPIVVGGVMYLLLDNGELAALK
ncbi:PQQ-like beta-propeller repeat protein [Celeribacter marinus]|uniref:PQQ-like beta-propeller repeat protein n=1 Tax=Celeribacter marinus TaxID=1397108 RepID=UPI00317CAEB6